MHILESPWFTGLVEKRAESAKGRLQAVFSIAGEWLAAPGIREQFSPELGVPSDFPQLKGLLAREALRAGAAQHEVLATQLLMLLTGAIAEQLRQPSLSVMQDATKASETLIHNACRNPRSRKLAASGIAAGVLLAGLAIFLHQPAFHNPSQATSTLVHYQAPMVATTPASLSPDEIEAVLALHDRIARGECRAPHMAMLPPGQTAAYMNIVELRGSRDPVSDGASVRAFMTWFSKVEATECYPKHTNDHINTVWVSRKQI